MNLQKYNVEVGNKESFIKKFKEHMDVDVKSIIVIDTLMSHVEPAGELPVGFVLMESGKWFLVGWTDRKKRCHPQNLYPHKKKEMVLYDSWSKQTYTYRVLYKCVFQRLRQLDDFPTVVSSISNWEQNRQALYSCAKLLDTIVLKKVKSKELELLKCIMSNNIELLNSTCSTLGLEANVEVLVQKVAAMYEQELAFDSEDAFRDSGILTLVKEHVLSKWNI